MACEVQVERPCTFTAEVERECAEACETLANYPELAITTSCPMPSGNNGVPYSQTLQATGGKPAYTWAIVSGSLPTGLSLASSTGVISGTPSAAGVFLFTFRVTDSLGQFLEKSCQIAIDVTYPDGNANGIAACGALTNSLEFQWRINSRVGPFFSQASPGRVAGIGKAPGSSKLIAVVSEDFGETWALADDTYPDLSSPVLVSFDCQQSGEDVLVATQQDNGRVAYSRFSLSSKTWAKKDKQVLASADVTASVGTAEKYSCSVTKRSTGSVIVQYFGDQETVSGTKYARSYYKESSDDGDTWGSQVALGHRTEAVHDVSARPIADTSGRIHFIFGNSSSPGWGHGFVQTLRANNSLSSIFQWFQGASLSQVQVGRVCGDYATWTDGGDFYMAIPFRTLADVRFVILKAADSIIAIHTGPAQPTGNPTINNAVDTAKCPQASMRHDGSKLHIMGKSYHPANLPEYEWHKSASAPYTSWTPTGFEEDDLGPVFDEHIAGDELGATVVTLGGNVYVAFFVDSNQYNLGILYNLIKVEDLPTDLAYTVDDWDAECGSSG